MYQDVIYNHHMFYHDKKYDYFKLCERIATSKSRCSLSPPINYPFLKSRQKKHQMEKEKLEEIEYTKILLLKKYKSMYQKHNKYHPSNLHFLSLPPSLKFSSYAQNNYELIKQNTYLGNKIIKIQKSPGKYNKERTVQDYKYSKKIGDKLVENSKYKNMLLNLVSPFTYQKRLNKWIEINKKKKILNLRKNKFNNTEKDFFKNKIKKLKIKNYFNKDFYKENVTDVNPDYNKKIEKILIERENINTTTKEEETV